MPIPVRTSRRSASSSRPRAGVPSCRLTSATRSRDVDVFINTADGKILGLAVIASEPRSFTIVNIIGNIDIDKLAKIEGQFGIPRVSQDE